MKSKLLIRLAAGCLLFFALGHTIGHFTRHDVNDPKAQEVLNIMAAEKFDMFGQMRSYDENYTGMSANLILTLFAFIAILWSVSGITIDNRKLAISILIPVSLCVLGFSITGFLYFFMLPAVTCLLATLLLCIAIYNLAFKSKAQVL